MADKASARLWAMADLLTPMAVRVAATLRLADHIAAGRRTAPDLAHATDVDADALDRMLRHLATVGVLRRDENGTYELTARGDTLRDDHPDGLRADLDITEPTGRADLAFVQLLHTIRSGEAAFPAQFGRSFWEDLAADPARAASFNAQMSADITADAPIIAAGYDWGSLGHVVDVGGGKGTLLATLLTAYPSLRGTVLDLPEATAAARDTLAAAGLAGRGTVVAGSFFEPLPPGAGGYLLSSVIHDWDDDSACAILRRCAEAAGRSGAVYVIENIGGDGGVPHTGMDLRLLAYFGGRARGIDEITALAADAKLRVVGVHPAGELSIVELAAG